MFSPVERSPWLTERTATSWSPTRRERSSARRASGCGSGALSFEAAAGAAVVFACVGNDDDLRSVVLGANGAFAGMGAGAVFVDHTTASAAVARELHAAGKARDIAFIDAPVSGGQAGAVNGALTVMCGGDAAPFAAIQPVAMAFAKAVTRVGDSGAGQLAKMVNQIAIAGLVQGLGNVGFPVAALRPEFPSSSPH